MTAPGAHEAVALYADTPFPIDLLVTDVIMPGMRGPEVARLLRARQPDLRVLFISGYADLSAAQKDEFDPGSNLLLKPFSPEQLLERVLKVLC